MYCTLKNHFKQCYSYKCSIYIPFVKELTGFAHVGTSEGGALFGWTVLLYNKVTHKINISMALWILSRKKIIFKVFCAIYVRSA